MNEYIDIIQTGRFKCCKYTRKGEECFALFEKKTDPFDNVYWQLHIAPDGVLMINLIEEIINDDTWR